MCVWSGSSKSTPFLALKKRNPSIYLPIVIVTLPGMFILAVAWQNQENLKPANTLISLEIHPVWSQNCSVSSGFHCRVITGSLIALKGSHFWFLFSILERPRLIWVFARRTCHFVGFIVLRLIWRFSWNAKNNISKDKFSETEPFKVYMYTLKPRKRIIHI